MRLCLTLLLIWVVGVSAFSQSSSKNKPKKNAGTVYTRQSAPYITSRVADSLLISETKELFDDYHLPGMMFSEKRISFSNRIKQAAGENIRAAFVRLESNHDFAADTFQSYVIAFKEAVKNTVATNAALRLQLTFTNSDRIQNYHTDIEVLRNGRLQVKETITVYNGNGTFEPGETSEEAIRAGGGNNQIVKGIYRTFPIWYRDKWMLNYGTTFNLRKITLNDDSVHFTTEHLQNGIVVKIGNPHENLPVGKQVYIIEYETDYQLKFLKDLDELAWNVTGNSWGFRIDRASCEIHFPGDTKILQHACYTGPSGSKDQACASEITDDHTIRFFTTRPLLPYEGISVGVGFGKGAVIAPAKQDLRIKLLKENQPVFLFPAIGLLILVYNLIVWRLYGRDKPYGVVIPRFYPPTGFSPAAMGYIFHQKFQSTLTAATLVDLAIRNHLKIEVEKKGMIFKKDVYKITKAEKQKEPASYDDYYDNAKDLIGSTIAKGIYNRHLADLVSAIEADCMKKYREDKLKNGFFRLNNGFMSFGNWLILLAIIYLVYHIMVAGINNNGFQLAYTVAGFIICVIIQSIFYKLMPSYTTQGKRAMRDILGFRMYLITADEHRLNLMNPPEKSLSLYERYLPFAIALGCEIEWGARFKDVISRNIAQPGSIDTYNSFSSGHFYTSEMTSSIVQGFSGSISSASTPPSSSNGGSSFSSGGGSSGGGGGGGGGGGW